LFSKLTKPPDTHKQGNNTPNNKTQKSRTFKSQRHLFDKYIEKEKHIYQRRNEETINKNMSESGESNYRNDQEIGATNDMGQTGMTSHGVAQDDPLMAPNPFAAPPDEDIFSFKERERMEKAIFRE